MECVMCAGSGFNRVLVDVYEGEERGGLCSDCERKADRIRRSSADDPFETGCLGCSRDGHVAIPRLDCYIEHRGRKLVEYDIGDETPRICYRCLDRLSRDAVAVESLARDAPL